MHVGILDLTAAVVVLAVVLLPERSFEVVHAYAPEPERVRAIALEQARLALEPGDAEAAERLARLLVDVGQTDWAVQVAGAATESAEGVSWRALLAVSSAHAERIEVAEAHRYAKLALDACLAAGSEECPASQRVRISLYYDQLAAGVESGIDPRVDPEGYREAVLAAVRIIRYRGETPGPSPASSDSESEAAGSEDSP